MSQAIMTKISQIRQGLSLEKTRTREFKSKQQSG